MKNKIAILLCLLTASCGFQTIKGVPLGDGTYKFISGGESKNQAFMESVSVMRNTCGYEGVSYQIIEQKVESTGQVYSYEKNHAEKGVGIDGLFVVSKSNVESENFRGYDITTFFKCIKSKT